jgi:hypothetical protein
MRRVIAVLVMLAFAAATAAPAIAACRMRAAQKQCCCKPAPSNSLCAPDCCDTASPAPAADLTTHLRAFAFVELSLIVPSPFFVEAAKTFASPPAAALIGLHERASPRLPLRI